MFFAFLLSFTIALDPFIYDGDTLYYSHTGLRLHGIDAPEMDTEFGPASRDALRGYLAGKELACTAVDVDKYHRFVTKCTANGEDISKWMTRNGWAVAYVYFSKDYIEDEAYARSHRLGMFQKDPNYAVIHIIKPLRTAKPESINP